jgi:hypothetical protein
MHPTQSQTCQLANQSISSPANQSQSHPSSSSSQTSLPNGTSNPSNPTDQSNPQILFVSQLNLTNQQLNSSHDPSHLLTTNINQLAHAEIEQIWIDKLLRAVFVRLFAQLFAGYRYCLIMIRINPKPVICFNKAMFLHQHNLADNEFMNRLLDSMSFQHFIEERGPSYRHCDVFDDLYAEVQSQLKDELEQQIELTYRNSFSFSANSLVMANLRKIAEKLYKYEYPQTSVLTQSKRISALATSHHNHHNQAWVFIYFLFLLFFSKKIFFNTKLDKLLARKQKE